LTSLRVTFFKFTCNNAQVCKMENSIKSGEICIHRFFNVGRKSIIL